MTRMADDSIAVLSGLFKEFPNEPFPIVHLMDSPEVPEAYRSLLDHEHHMTVTMEAHHNESVRVRVLSEISQDGCYSRILNLVGEKTGKLVLFGLMRVRMNSLPAQVQDEILARKEPLGRILIRYEIMRKIELIKLLKIDYFPAREHWFHSNDKNPYYGRIAMIHCEGRPAIELFEVVGPVSKS